MTLTTDEILRSRARALAAPSRGFIDDMAAWLVLAVGATRAAVPIDRVAGVLQPAPIASVPRSPERAIVGIRADRDGRILAVADLERIVGTTPSNDHATRLVVVIDSEPPFGLLADAVDATVSIGAVADVESTTGFAVGVGDDGVLVLEIDAMLGDFLLGGEATPSLNESPTEGHP